MSVDDDKRTRTEVDTPARKTVIIDETERAAPAPSNTENYQIIRRIAAGGMGVVYLARDEQLGRYVALKRLSRKFWSNSVMKGRFFREAKSIASLNHSHIVHVYQLDEDGHGPYIAMEYIEGYASLPDSELPGEPLTLEDRVDRDGPMPIEEAITLLIKLSSALSYAHEQGVVHRDLKPSNVLLTQAREPKIVDFGLAVRRDSDDNLTKTGTKMISLGYSAPEQEADASTVDKRADIYSLGGVLYYCLTGDNPRFFRESRVPEHLRRAVCKALENDRERRWENVDDFERALYNSSVVEPGGASKATWWCKWCHEINALSRRFCVECGWDGIEVCPECENETRIGVQFCGSCGTDIRAFEELARKRAETQSHVAGKQFHLVLEETEHVSFQPKGDHGRMLVDSFGKMRVAAEQSLKRRDELVRLIPLEFNRGNFDVVREYLADYARVGGDDRFDAVREQLPKHIAHRDLDEAWVLYRSGDLASADDLVRGVIETMHGDTSGAERLLRKIGRKQIRRSSLRVATVVLLLFLIYLLIAGPALRTAHTATPTGHAAIHTLYAPVTWMRKNTVFRAPIDWLLESYDLPAETD